MSTHNTLSPVATLLPLAALPPSLKGGQSVGRGGFTLPLAALDPPSTVDNNLSRAANLGGLPASLPPSLPSRFCLFPPNPSRAGGAEKIVKTQWNDEVHANFASNRR